MTDSRWQQRRQNFLRALARVEQALAMPALDELQRAGLIQFFELTFELSWKLLKDYLEEQGFQDLNSPRGVLKKAFEVGLVAEGQSWLQGLEDRNLTAHTYDEATAHKVEELIRSRYLPLFEALKQRFEGLGER